METIKYIYIPVPVSGVIAQIGDIQLFDVGILASNAIHYALSGKTVCLSSLGIKTENKDIMLDVIKIINRLGFDVFECVAEDAIYTSPRGTQKQDFWAGSTNYYTITPSNVKVAYYSNENIPSSGYKQLSFLIEHKDGALRSGYDGKTSIKTSDVETTNYTKCNLLVPYNAYLWLGVDNEIYYSINIHGEKIKATKANIGTTYG